jgi:Na+-transporting NADH:ubiquinone oxidoreductase subunit NqrE
MEWYNYIAVFFSGVFFSNAAPHFVYGVCGDKFPTPFSKPPGKGLSTAYVNALWGSFNILVGYILLRVSHLQTSNCLGMAVFFVGIVLVALMSSTNFAKKG